MHAGFGIFSDGMSVCLMDRPDIKECIQQLEEEAAAQISARAGYERIAYGSVNDAVRLMYAEEEKIPEILENLDLFCVSEIKKPKGGGIEIKFFDRLKALEKLGQCHAKKSDNFIQALEQTASEENWEEDSGDAE